ncbi:MAG TPA: tetratricopeptide repeat protein [Steroidobacteraceae bacterium]|nr:tetratricopeptide repeat protein [Steroidobacteraceae bacterium]
MSRHSTDVRLARTCVLLAGLLAGCASGPEERDAAATAPPAAAIERFEQAVEALDSGDLDVATRDFAEIGRSYPEFATPLVNLGIAHARAGELEQAEAALREAVERAPALAVAWSELGIVLRRQGRFADARDAYDRAVAADPAYANAHLNLGVLCDLYLDEPQTAAEAYERYLALASEPDPRVDSWLTEIRSRLGRDGRTARMGP